MRGVIVDFGGTLFGHATLADTVRTAASRLGVAWPAGRAEELAGRIEQLAGRPEELARGRDLDAAVWRERWSELYAVADGEVRGLGAQIYRDMHDPLAWQPYRDTLWTLRALVDAEIPVAVVSNTGWDVRSVFAHHGVAYCIAQFVLSCEVGLVKPDPAIFALACDALLREPAEVLMVGDDATADAGAVGAGIRTLLLARTAPGADNGIGGLLALAGIAAAGAWPR